MQTGVLATVAKLANDQQSNDPTTTSDHQHPPATNGATEYQRRPTVTNGDHRRLETRFRSPVYPGDTLQVCVAARDKKETRKGKWLVCDLSVANQTGEVIATGDGLAEIAR